LQNLDIEKCFFDNFKQYIGEVHISSVEEDLELLHYKLKEDIQLLKNEYENNFQELEKNTNEKICQLKLNYDKSVQLMLYMSTVIFVPMLYEICIIFWFPFESKIDIIRFFIGLIFYVFFGAIINLFISIYSLLNVDCFKWGKTRALNEVVVESNNEENNEENNENTNEPSQFFTA
jgi:hypothetical protein